MMWFSKASVPMQATSPVNPAETCLTPPPEVTANQSECDDVSTSSTTAVEQETAHQSTPTPVQQITVQDASNQTDTPPVSEDENCYDSDKLQVTIYFLYIEASPFLSFSFISLTV